MKRRDMDTLADLHSKLQQESQKKKRKSPRSPTIPPELAYPPLEMVRRYLYSCKPSPKGKMLNVLWKHSILCLPSAGLGVSGEGK